MHAMRPLMLLCVAGMLLASGCMSTRVTTNLKPESDPALKSPAGTFYIASLKYASIFPRLTKSALAKFDEKAERGILPVLRKECMARYPALFADESANAIPLGVEVNSTTTDDHIGKTVGWMLGTLMLCGPVFPCPGQTDQDFDVKVCVWNGRENMRGSTLQKSFRQETHQWVSFLTPLALITIPGESDFPKISESILSIREMENRYYQQVAQQVATALAKLVVTKDSAYWTAQPREQAAPGVPSALPTLPTVLPPPAETAAPF